MTHRTFISIILAAALAVTGMTSTAAQAGDRDVARWVAGAVALGLIGAAIADQRRDDRAVTRNRGGHDDGYHGHRHRGDDRYDDDDRRRGHDWNRGRDWNRGHHGGVRDWNRGHHGDRRALPGQCRRDVPVRGGVLHGFGRHCLLNNYAHFNALPHRCAVQTRGQGGRGVIYDSYCLQRHGYQVARSRK